MRFRQAWRENDEGTSLILALAFITICGVFVVAALQKGNGATLAGERVQDRGKLQYALDAGVARAIQKLKEDAALVNQSPSVNPKYCPDPTTPGQDPMSDYADPAGFTVNGYKITYRCTTLSGGNRSPGSNDRNYAIITTSTSSGALQTSGAANGTCQSPYTANCLTVDGSIYLAGSESTSDFAQPLVLTTGSVVQGRPCSSFTGLDSVFILPPTNKTGTRQCTPQPLTGRTGALPNVSLTGVGQPANLATVSGYQNGVTDPVSKCTIFLPGKYTTPPNFSASSGNSDFYFVSGYYWFDGTNNQANQWSNWTLPSGKYLTGGVPYAGASAANDTAPTGWPGRACAGMNDAMAEASVGTLAAGLLSQYTSSASTPLTSGVEWIMTGVANLNVNGNIILNRPSGYPYETNADPTQAEEPVNLYEAGPTGANALDQSTRPSWLNDSWTGTGNVLTVANGQNPTMAFHAKIFAPDGTVFLFSTNTASAAAGAGVVAKTLTLKASSGAGQNLQLVKFPHEFGDQTPPRRLIRITAVDASGNSAAKNVAVVGIENFTSVSVSGTPTYSYLTNVWSWRTGNSNE